MSFHHNDQTQNTKSKQFFTTPRNPRKVKQNPDTSKIFRERRSVYNIQCQSVDRKMIVGNMELNNKSGFIPSQMTKKKKEVRFCDDLN